MKQILHSDWLFERARQAHITSLGLPAFIPHKKKEKHGADLQSSYLLEIILRLKWVIPDLPQSAQDNSSSGNPVVLFSYTSPRQKSQ